VKDGGLPKAMMGFMEQYKPEGAWFTTDHGNRTAFFVFDLKEPSLMPSIAEPFFSTLDAQITMSPAMNVEDLKVGIERAMKAGR
jgi:hypothetical protein